MASNGTTINLEVRVAWWFRRIYMPLVFAWAWCGLPLNIDTALRPLDWAVRVDRI